MCYNFATFVLYLDVITLIYRENRLTSSETPLSAKLMKVIKRSDFFPVFLFYRVRADSVDEGSIGKLGDSVSKSV